MMPTEIQRRSREVSNMATETDIALIADHMQKLRDYGATPNRVKESGLDHAIRYVYLAYGSLEEFYRNILALHIATEAAKTVNLESKRKREKE